MRGRSLPLSKLGASGANAFTPPTFFGGKMSHCNSYGEYSKVIKIRDWSWKEVIRKNQG